MKNILNEEFKSEFFKKLNKNLSSNYVEDNNNSVSFTNDTSKLLKEIFKESMAYKKDGSFKNFEKVKKDISEYESKYNIGSTLINKFYEIMGISKYGYREKNKPIEINYRVIEDLKYYLIKLCEDPKYYTNNGKDSVRTNNTTGENKEENSFKFISNILKRSSYGLDIANVVDADVDKINKIPKLITDRSPLSDKYLFWFKSNDPQSNTLLDDDKLIGISLGSFVYYPYNHSWGRHHDDIKVKNLAELSNKLFAISRNQDAIDKMMDKRRNRFNSSVIFKYEKEKISDYARSSAVEMDELPNANLPDSPSYVIINGETYSKHNVGQVLSNNEFIRDGQYIDLINDKIQKYKTLANNIRMNRSSKEEEEFDKSVDATVKMIHKYLYLYSDTHKTQDLRRIYSKINSLLGDYEKYLYHKKELMKSYSSYHKSEASSLKQKISNACLELFKIIDQQ